MTYIAWSYMPYLHKWISHKKQIAAKSTFHSDHTTNPVELLTTTDVCLQFLPATAAAAGLK